MESVAKKTVVITGGASGIGFATAQRFVKEGANVVLADIETAALDQAVIDLSAEGANVIGVPCDVAVLEDVRKVAEKAQEHFGGVHVVFNNAGVGGGSTIASPPEVWEWVMGVNVTGVTNGLAVFLPLFLAQDEGHIVNTASLAGLGGVPGMGPYCASKFAVVGLSESLWYELAGKRSNVHCSVLCPGFVKTRIFESERNSPESLREWVDQPESQALREFTRQIVESGLDPSVVANEVLGAVLDERFWILPHERVALATMRQRMEWMEGGTPPRIDLSEAAKK
jgi:NAD(P)-dependent dehydrogenase (short-subunit alcohol dehydrogenase family)